MVSLRPCGIGRFFTAGFLLFWLCGWAAGEGFALWILANGACALMSGTPLGSGHAPLQTGPALAVGAFLLFWLALWTLGGLAATRELLRLLWSEDRLSAEAGGLVLLRRLGPLRMRREFPRDTLRRIFLSPGNRALAIETRQATVELSRLGTREEREAAAAALRSELGIPDVALVPAGERLPKGWEEIITPEGDRAVVPDRAMRKIQARAAGVGALGIGAIALIVVQESLKKPELLAIALNLVLATIALVCGAVWLGRGRMEWRIGNGVLTLRRRFGPNARDVFEARRFELITTHDSSDTSEWFSLEAVSDAAGIMAPDSFSRRRMKNRRRITSVTHDATIPRRLGAYLARAGSVPFEDRTTPEAREAELAAIQAQLEKSGPLGRFAVRLVLETRKRKRA